jgi:uroporphyrinogen decarboxylase
MRQAGRFNPRHRELYEKHGVRGITTTPELNAEVTTLPVKQFGVDAAVMYADIMLPLEDMGIEFHYGEGDKGPVMETDLSSPEDVDTIRILQPERGVEYILEAIKRVKDRLPTTPLIGFSGGPFTLSAYVIEGEASRTFQRTKSFMYNHPDAYRTLMEKLTESISRYLQAQAEAGVDVIQLFESWMGALSPQTYREFVEPYEQQIFDDLSTLNQPTIQFATNTAGMLDDQFNTGANAIGVDWRLSLETVAERAGKDKPIMGNLDPATVFAPDDVTRTEIHSILEDGADFPGHVFNLGHRVPNDTPIDSLKYIVDVVHELSAD